LYKSISVFFNVVIEATSMNFNVHRTLYLSNNKPSSILHLQFIIIISLNYANVYLNVNIKLMRLIRIGGSFLMRIPSEYAALPTKGNHHLSTN